MNRLNLKRETEDSEKEKNPTRRLLELVEDSGVVLFHDQFDKPHAALPDAPGQVVELQSKTFQRWLARLAWGEMGWAVSLDTTRTVTQVLEAKAQFDEEQLDLQVRLGRHDGAIYYDLGDGRAVRITVDGWKVIQKAPLIFRRFSSQKAQVPPVHGGDLRQFLSFVNLPDKGKNDGWDLLLLVWIVAAFIPDFPHPVLVAYGPQGAAKSTLFRLLKELIDPYSTRTLSPTKNQEDFVLQALHNWFIPLDNLSNLEGWMSDAVSRACTGDGFSKRQLYTDADEVVFSFQRVLGINGVNLVVDKPDLLDRCFLLCLERISDSDRCQESDLWKRFLEAKPALLGAIFGAVSGALKFYPNVALLALPRMADFARWGVAIAQALGYQAEDFLAAYGKAIQQQHREAIYANPVAQATVKLVEELGRWEGTPSELLFQFNRIAKDLSIDTRSRIWPKHPNWMWRRLGEVQTNLEALDIKFDKGEKEDRYIKIWKVEGDDAGEIHISTASTPDSSEERTP